MAAGLPTYLMEIEFTAGVWTDVSADVELLAKVRAHFGRTREGEPVGPGSLEFTLMDPTGMYVPDNPTSSLFPNVVENKRVRFKVTKGSTRTRFVGFITSWAPFLPPGGSAADGRVAVTAVTFDGIHNRPFRSHWVESILDVIRDTPGEVADLWVPLPDSQNADELASLGNGGGTATRIEATLDANPGEVTATTAERVRLDGVLDFAPNPDHYGPVYRLDIGDDVDTSAATGVSFYLRTSELVGSDGPYTAVSGFNADGDLRWAVKYVLSGGKTRMELWNKNDTSEVVLTSRANNGRWWVVNISTGGLGSVSATDEGGNYTDVTPGTPISPMNTRTIIIGGDMANSSQKLRPAGKQRSCPTFQIGPIEVNGTGTGGTVFPRLFTHVAPSVAMGAVDDIAGATTVATGSDDPAVTLTPDLMGATYADIRARIARTTGAIAWVAPNGDVSLRLADAVRTATPVLTFDIEEDGNGILETVREKSSAPTRATVTYPLGVVSVIDTDAEADGPSYGVQFDTEAATAEQARYAAEFAMAESTALRISRVGINLASAENDLYSQVDALYPAARARITNLPAWLGYTQADVLVQGWWEEYGLDGVNVVMDCSPADSPRQGLVETDRVGATDTTLTNTITSSATAVDFTIGASGELWTTDAGDYPLKVKIDGEIMSLPSAPASGAAPSYTSVSRGQDGTIAVAHTAGATVQVHHAMTAGMG